MRRITHNFTQGTSQWHEHRSTHFGASDAPAMMGISKYRSRADLIREKATGIAPTISDDKQRLFDRGHAAEAKIRPVIERLISDELYPVTMSADLDGLPLSASLDGLTMDGGTILECKLWSEPLAAQVRARELEPHYTAQLEHQLLVSGAERVIFATGDGEDNLEWMEYRAVPGRSDALVAGWRQFRADVAAYVPEATKPVAVAAPVEGFGALSLRVEGRVLASNLDAFRAGAEAFIERLPKPAELQTDQDFANADAAVKACAEAESRIEAATDAALAQMADVDAVLRTAGTIREAIRAARLALDKAVKAEKENRKAAIVRAGVDSVREHYAAINATLGEHVIGCPVAVTTDIGSSIKGLRTLTSITDAVDKAAAAAKIEASQRAERVRACVAILAEFKDHAHLFADRVSLCATKEPDDLRAIAGQRVAEHERKEAARIEAERERIRAEEAARIERERIAAERVERETGNVPTAAAAPIAAEPAAAGIAPAAPTGAVRDSGARIKLGDLNAMIAPLSITADGLAQLGFQPVGTERAAKLYAASDLPAIFDAMTRTIDRARAQKVAA